MGLEAPQEGAPRELRLSVREKLRRFVFDEHFREPFQLFLKLVNEVFFRTFLNKSFKGV